MFPTFELKEYGSPLVCSRYGTGSDYSNLHCSTSTSTMTSTGWWTEYAVAGCQLVSDSYRNCVNYNAYYCFLPCIKIIVLPPTTAGETIK